MATISISSTVGDLVATRPSHSRVFQKFGIDFCCGGKKRLAEACSAKGLDPGVVLDALAANEAAGSRDGADVVGLTLGQLCDHIEQTHHAYLRAELPRVGAMVKKVAAVHGAVQPWTIELASVFADFAAELNSHMIKEEQVLFPWIRGLEGSEPCAQRGCGGTIANPIGVMEHEHEGAGQSLARMRELSHGYTPPAGACNTFLAALNGLALIEADMHQHVHKENNVLFPKAVRREQDAARGSLQLQSNRADEDLRRSRH